MTRALEFDCNLPGLLHEMIEGNPAAGPLRTALNITMPIIRGMVERAAELDDPKLNIFMLRLGLYDVEPEGPRKAAIEAQQHRMGEGVGGTPARRGRDRAGTAPERVLATDKRVPERRGCEGHTRGSM